MGRFVTIDDPEDPRIADYRAIRERDLVGRRELFIAEGEVVLTTLIASRRHRPLSLLLDASRVAGLAERLATVEADVPIFVATRSVIDAIAGFPLHRGILAIGRRGALPDAAALLAGLGDRATVVVALGIANHDNMGGLFRNAAAFGADAVLIDAASCDPFYRKAIRVSVGHVLTVPFARIAAEVDPLGLLAAAGFEALALTPSGGEALAGLEPAARTAALFGTEGPGLSADLLARTRRVTIEMAPGVDSLNVATCAGVVLHRLATAPRRA
ncbi:RNA methyltransferase [Siculibacillus lacustris]|uniref:RNA methyltransferase n=1 Tax=Siculibacillus lacustris TaxID=1549641 RepID=A0A4Q9VE09_9HYPH|nr:RNA methyltransferase [Siculibacillus lacustris]TBW32369.1 RNA methyltransferase [Siculibacillus lacustris]